MILDDGFVMSRKLEIMAMNKSVLVQVLDDTYSFYLFHLFHERLYRPLHTFDLIVGHNPVKYVN